MSGYTKLHRSILASTIWREDNATRITWVTMMAMADENGLVEASVPGLCDFARLPRPEVEEALKKLSSPDPDSRTPDHDGRRIEKVDGGWRLINHDKYKYLQSADDRREKTAERVRRFRERHACNADVTHVTHVTLGNACNGTRTEQNRTEEVQKKRTAKAALSIEPEQLPEPVQTQAVADAVNRWLTYKRERRESYKETGLKAFLSGLKDKPADLIVAEIERAMFNNWAGIHWQAPVNGSQPHVKQVGTPFSANAGLSNMDRYRLEKELEKVEEKIQSMRDDHNQGGGIPWTDQERAQIKQLKERRDAIKTKLPPL